MFDRVKSKDILNQIGSYNPYTRYQVIGDSLHVSAPGGLCEEQKVLLRQYKWALVEYLTIPPAIEGQCLRSHEIKWVCSPYGLWVCSCYLAPYNHKAYQSRYKDLSNYWSWTKETAALK